MSQAQTISRSSKRERVELARFAQDSVVVRLAQEIGVAPSLLNPLGGVRPRAQLRAFSGQATPRVKNLPAFKRGAGPSGRRNVDFFKRPRQRTLPGNHER